MLTLTGYIAITQILSSSSTKYKLKVRFPQSQPSNAVLFRNVSLHALPVTGHMYLASVHSSGPGYKILCLKDVLDVTKDTIPSTMATVTGRIVELNLPTKTFQVQFDNWDPDTKESSLKEIRVNFSGPYAVAKIGRMHEGWGIEVAGLWKDGVVEMVDAWLTAKERASDAPAAISSEDSDNSLDDFMASCSPKKRKQPEAKKPEPVEDSTILIHSEAEEGEEDEEEEDEEEELEDLPEEIDFKFKSPSPPPSPVLPPSRKNPRKKRRTVG